MSSVFIVDDQSTNRKVLSMLAATLGTDVQVFAFSNPLEALSCASEQAPDLLITDFKMPTLNGAELIRRFRTVPDCKHVPAVVVTAYEDSQFRSLALEAGADDFILSPLDHREFCAQSRKWLAVRHAEQHSNVSPLQAAPALPAIQQSGLGEIDLYNRLLENAAGALLCKTKELGHIEAEMQSILQLVQRAAVIVDENLHVRRFTPEISEIYALTAQDIGRPLTRIVCHLDYESLAQDFRQTALAGESFRRRLRHRSSESSYVLRLIPLRNEDASLAGATLLFTPLSVLPGGLKTAQTIH
jgi:CheY-like chemotaxis protein